jgi:flagellar biosynthesis/type III secretory pathway protein FliH
MKPLPIADYLSHLGREADEKAAPRREVSPFRPRSLQSSAKNPQSVESRLPGSFGSAAKIVGAVKPHGEGRPPTAAWDRRATALDPAARDMLVGRETERAQDLALRLAEAHARGREEGLAEARAEAVAQRAADLAATQERSMIERLEFQLNEYAQLEAAIRSGFAQVEEKVGAAVARILGPFLVKQVARHAADELCKNIARICAAGSPGLITIRGPERMLALLRKRLADLPAEVDYVEDDSVEVVVEANVTRIASELRPWADLLASLDA